MATLSMRLRKDHLETEVPNAVVVDVRQIGTIDGGYPDRPFEQLTPIVAGRDATTSLDVPPGQYQLLARLPDGTVLRKTLMAVADGAHEVVFDTGRAPEPWLSWQAMTGALEPITAGNRDTAADGLKWSPGPPDLGGAVYGRPNWFEDFGSDGAAATQEADDPFSGFATMPQRAGTAVGRPLGGGGELSPIGTPPWVALPLDLQRPALRLEAVGGPDGEVVANGLNLQVDDMRTDGVRGVWRLSTVARAFVPGEERRRYSARIRHGDGQSLVMLPMPWRDDLGQAVPVELLCQPVSQGRSPVRVSVLDPEMSGLLSYLGAGRLPEALAAGGGDVLVARVSGMIRGKRQNPLAAAAGAYVGLAIPEAGPERNRWSPWLRNLMDWFPTLPDGAILYARDRLERANTRGDLAEALNAFKEGHRRGVPAFAVGVQHLLAGLYAFAQPPQGGEAWNLYDPEAQRMHAEVERLALRVDATQTFTVIQQPLGADGHV